MKSVKQILSERARKRVIRLESAVAKKMLKEGDKPQTKKSPVTLKARKV